MNRKEKVRPRPISEAPCRRVFEKAVPLERRLMEEVVSEVAHHRVLGWRRKGDCGLLFQRASGRASGEKKKLAVETTGGPKAGYEVPSERKYIWTP